MKSSIDTAKLKATINLIELAGRYVELRKATPKESHGPCPKCGGDNRFYVQWDFFACRKCHPKQSDVFEFVQWLNGCSFKEAAAILTDAPLPSSTPRRAPAPKRLAEQPVDWAQRSIARVAQAQRRLLDEADTTAAAGRAYLEGRGLDPHSWCSFGLGFVPDAALPGTEGKERAPAIVIPWYRAGKLCGIRYRFLQWTEYSDAQGKPRREKQTAQLGSDFAGKLFGGQALGGYIHKLATLLICEGELNAISVWQVAHETKLNVLSLGSESAHVTPQMSAYAAQYGRVLVWLDREERAQAAMAALSGAYGIKSPSGQDANNLLQQGKLGSVLALHRFHAALDDDERQRLLYDLEDAPGDDSTMAVIAHIKQVLTHP